MKIDDFRHLPSEKLRLLENYFFQQIYTRNNDPRKKQKMLSTSRALIQKKSSSCLQPAVPMRMRHRCRITLRPKQRNGMYAPPKRAFIDGQPTTFIASLLATDGVYYVAKGVILFTMFYTTMNWWYFRRMREEYEKDLPKKDSKKNE